MISTSELTPTRHPPVRVTYQRRKRRHSVEDPSADNLMASILSLKRQLNSHTEVIKTVASCPSTPLRKRTRAGLPKTPSSNHTTNFKQMYLQFGQKNLGPTLCSECGLSYQRGQSEDELLHDKYHQSIVRGVKYLGYKSETVLRTFVPTAGKPEFKNQLDIPKRAAKPESANNTATPLTSVVRVTPSTSASFARIVVITDKSTTSEKNKAKEVMEVTNTNLGSAAFTDDMWSKYKVFLCISATQYVMGCAVVERIKTAYATTTRSSTDGVVDKCSPIKASCGISRVWVSPRFRRQSVATELLEAVRENFIYGLTIARTEIAFSQPTAMGAALARHFTGRFDFLVYIE
ncbi:hypothetical protein H4R33_004869 [Dimargaris cristalligena]|nr:hypothetical protein H4R33_004869 [Dimargaris cristalligena]